jgi:hypothetical protein
MMHFLFKDIQDNADEKVEPENKKLQEEVTVHSLVKPMSYLDKLALPKCKIETKRKHEIEIDPEVRKLM